MGRGMARARDLLEDYDKHSPQEASIDTTPDHVNICPECLEEFEPEMMEVGFGSYRSRVRRFGRLCSKCGPGEDERRAARAAVDAKDLAEIKRQQLAARDPEEALLAAGFADPDLFGQHLRTFERSTGLQQERWQVAYEFAAGRLKRSNLAMLGHPGRGKTHLARGIACSWIMQGREVRYLLLGDLIAKCKDLMGRDGETPDQYISRLYRFDGLLIVDELGRSSSGDWVTNSVLYPLVDRRKSVPTVWLSNFPLEHLEKHYDSAVVSRLNKGQVIWFPEDMEDFRQR